MLLAGMGLILIGIALTGYRFTQTLEPTTSQPGPTASIRNEAARLRSSARAPEPSATPSPSPTQTPSPSPSPTITSTPPAIATSTPTPPPTEPLPTNTLLPPAPTATTATYQTASLDAEPAWQPAIHTLDGGFIGRVTTEELNIRVQPTTSAEIVGSTFARHTLTVYESVMNIPEDGRWYRIGEGQYVAAAYVDPFVAPEPAETFQGRWVDVNLSTFYATAYEGGTPVYSAIITAGRGDRTPRGTFWIFYRVRNETMDSATVGIPEGDPEYYYLENVEYTQYFKKGGFALHGNYWTPPDRFGAFSSNGCIGLLNCDAAWFWNFFADGGLVNIHD